jgi:hypothetical protein
MISVSKEQLERLEKKGATVQSDHSRRSPPIAKAEAPKPGAEVPVPLPPAPKVVEPKIPVEVIQAAQAAQSAADSAHAAVEQINTLSRVFLEHARETGRKPKAWKFEVERRDDLLIKSMTARELEEG